MSIECCVTSNVDTGSVACYETHPIKSFYDQDLRVTVNTDNRTISDTTITNEFMQLMKYKGFTRKDVIHITRHSIKAAFLRSQPTRELLIELDRYAANNGSKRRR